MRWNGRILRRLAGAGAVALFGGGCADAHIPATGPQPAATLSRFRPTRPAAEQLRLISTMGPTAGSPVSTLMANPGKPAFSDCDGGGLGCGWADLMNWGYTWELVAGTYTYDLSILALVSMQGSGAIGRGNSWYDQLLPDEVFAVACASARFMDDPSCADWDNGSNTCDVEGNKFWAKTFHEIVTENGIPWPASNSGSLSCEPPPPPPPPGCGGGDDDDDDEEEYAYYCDGDDDGGGGGGGGWTKVCSTEYIWIEISYDGGETWSTLWEGYAEVCEYYAT
jgi:hypothetical protein